eukprot:280299-Chlamydomonas_euryale.AAC.5
MKGRESAHARPAASRTTDCFIRWHLISKRGSCFRCCAVNVRSSSVSSDSSSAGHGTAPAAGAQRSSLRGAAWAGKKSTKGRSMQAAVH